MARRARQLLWVLWLLPSLGSAVPWAGLATALNEPGRVSEPLRDELSRFYFSRGYQPLWFDADRLSVGAEQLWAVLQQADQEGLDPEDYLTESLQRVCGGRVQPLACELALSDSLLRYAGDVGYGVLEAAEVDPKWLIPQQPLPTEVLLAAVADSPDPVAVLRELPPPHPEYRRLRDALAEYRRSGPLDYWFAIPDGPTLRPGDHDERVMALRERLGENYPELLLSADPARFGPELTTAVTAFQARHGLAADGVVGPDTLAALNVPLQARIAQVRLNMERWRWLPRDLEPSRILVNLAAFELTLVQPGQPPRRMRTINGRPDRSSPVLQDRITGLVLNPDWTVPRRLAVEDLLPQLKRDPLALQDKQIAVLRRDNGELVAVDPAAVDWRSLHGNNFPYILRQAPGPHNALGRLKFEMPNRQAIYLHDTPAKGLFHKSRRAFSSGCIRVDKPLQLAARLLGGDLRATSRRLLQGIEDGQTERLAVAPPMPVYLLYLTAWVDASGNLQFREDVYGRDVPMRDQFSFP